MKSFRDLEDVAYHIVQKHEDFEWLDGEEVVLPENAPGSWFQIESEKGVIKKIVLFKDNDENGTDITDSELCRTLQELVDGVEIEPGLSPEEILDNWYNR